MIYPYSVIRDRVGNLAQFDDETLFGNESNFYTKIAFIHNISPGTHYVFISAVQWNTHSVFTELLSSKTSRNMKAKRAETDARSCYVSQFAVVNAQPRLVNDHFTGGGQESFNHENFVSHAYWTFDLRSSLYIINLPHSCKAVWNATVTFFCCNHTALLTKQQTCLVPSTPESLQVRVGVLNSTLSYFTQFWAPLYDNT